MTAERRYSAAVKTVGWLVMELESTLEKLPAGAFVDRAFVRHACATRVPTADEIALAMNGLVGLGVLQPTEHGYAFDSAVFLGTRDYRRGFRDGMAVATHVSESPLLTLCMAVPPGLPRAFKQTMADAATDLRAGIVNVIASATGRLVLASPFWDVATARDIGELARRRAEAGVKVDILGRSDAANDAMSYLNGLFADCEGVRVLRWYEPIGSGESVTTFHFKAVIADDGARTYVGTANLTHSGLRSTMELGFIVGGPQGRAVARIVDSVISVSQRVGP
jgi:hypothetical protein